MAKCNNDCFNCVYDDCIISGISSAERKEIRERDARYFKAPTKTKSLLIQKPTRVKHRGRKW